MKSASVHVPVLPAETIKWLAPCEGATVIDGTLGGGGHTRLLIEKVGDEGCVIAFDRDADAIARAAVELQGQPVMLAERNYAEIPEILEELQIEAVDGILLDLGLSTDQLADDQRGFSFHSEGPIDLRFDTSEGQPASHLLAHLGEETLADLIYQFGEERLSRRIAKAIVERRKVQPIETAAELAELVRRAYPSSQRHGRIHPATRTFQALRIAVNDELKSLEIALRQLPDCLKPDGRLAIISFHSLEDRRVKQAFRDDPRVEVLTRKPILPSEAEVAANPASRSAKMRVCQRVTS